ncbi:MAG: hypothetical protein KJ847_01575, partial [Firmicutes bacterium]|nr:hypothetical protein [Bacillota bacterium]
MQVRTDHLGLYLYRSRSEYSIRGEISIETAVKDVRINSQQPKTRKDFLELILDEEAAEQLIFEDES